MRAIIFDIDGTLLDSMAVDCEIFDQSIRAILGPVRFRDSYNDYKDVTDRGIVEELMTDNGRSPDSEVVGSIRSKFVSELSNHIEISGPFAEIPGASDFICQLSIEADTRVSIATGCWRESALLKLESSGIVLDNIPIATCDDSPSRVDIMKVALARIGDSFDAITYFGDAQWDLEACQVLGWNFVAVGPNLRGLESYYGYSI